MYSQTNRPSAKNDAIEASLFGEALISAINKGAALSDVLGTVADSKPLNVAEAITLTREFAREYAAA